MNHRMFDRDIITKKINNEIERIALILMQHEDKDFCLAHVTERDWKLISIKNNDGKFQYFVIVPSMAFKRLVLEKEYLRVVEKYPDHFGTNNDWDIVTALKKNAEPAFPVEYTPERYLEYLRGETMAYVFALTSESEISDRILRLDLCRGIKDNKFYGGLFHVLKHFTVEGYETISHKNKEYELEIWSEIVHLIIRNFFTDYFTQDESNDNIYNSISILKDGYKLKGAYFKEEDIPVYFLNTMFICGKE